MTVDVFDRAVPAVLVADVLVDPAGARCAAPAADGRQARTAASQSVEVGPSSAVRARPQRSSAQPKKS